MAKLTLTIEDVAESQPSNGGYTRCRVSCDLHRRSADEPIGITDLVFIALANSAMVETDRTAEHLTHLANLARESPETRRSAAEVLSEGHFGGEIGMEWGTAGGAR